jgi:ubiquinone/menaquinone biosynthesis C-methylase UbiE
VREVVAVDLVPELLEQGRLRAAGFDNVEFVEGDATKLPFELSSFDFAGTLRSLHHIARPELVVAELTRVTRRGGRILVVDQLAPIDPLAASELNAFERARDPSHTRTFADVDLRQLFESNGLVLVRADYVSEERELDPYLDLAGCEGEERKRAEMLAPSPYVAELGWYLLDRR